MDKHSSVIHTPEHQALISDYTFLDCAEDRLAWLMERQAQHATLPGSYCTPERRVPGCLSGLWLYVEQSGDGSVLFSARSESAMVQGVVSFLCDLYSGRSAHQILTLGDTLAQELKLEGVLSLTRRRAVASTVAFFAASADEIAHSTRTTHALG
jgi:cysteine desulfuration protein SufE